jgi:eukaryotic-like serine/threonine-protein kinase
MSHAAAAEPYQITRELPEHLRSWELPPGWAWGPEGLVGQYRHYQELIDALGRSLSLVSAPDPAHASWLEMEARHLAHRNHPAVPTTYHYWASFGASRRGPGYLRRWIVGETLGAHLRRAGPDDAPDTMRLMRELGSALSYLHDTGDVHGCVSPEVIWTAPMGRLWIIGWQWAIPSAEIPEGIYPDYRFMPVPPEWAEPNTGWKPTQLTDQWQLAAACFASLTGELPPSREIPPITLLRPDCPQSLASVIDRALSVEPSNRYESIAAMLRAVDRVAGSRTMVYVPGAQPGLDDEESDEVRLRWALADDYEVLASLGAGSFGSVWRVRDLTLGREVALKLLHPHVTRDERAVARFRREAKLAAQLAHPAIVPIYDWDSRGDVVWYTMELAEGGSVSELVARSGPRTLGEIAPQVDFVLSGLAAGHAVGIIHRDLKPENLLVDRYRRWRIADFGIAQAAGEDRAGTSGTPAFSAPEQLLGEQQDGSVDCFSLTAIVAFTLSGAPPFGDDDARTILARGLRGDMDVSMHPPEIGAWLRRGLASAPEDRFADALAMQAAWRTAVQEVFERERRVPWWRRWISSGDTSAMAWTGDGG